MRTLGHWVIICFQLCRTMSPRHCETAHARQHQQRLDCARPPLLSPAHFASLSKHRYLQPLDYLYTPCTVAQQCINEDANCQAPHLTVSVPRSVWRLRLRWHRPTGLLILICLLIGTPPRLHLKGLQALARDTRQIHTAWIRSIATPPTTHILPLVGMMTQQ